MSRSARYDGAELSRLLCRQALRVAVLTVTVFLLVASGVARAQYAYPPDAPDATWFSVDSPLGAIEYVEARGLRLGDFARIGGFTTFEIDRERGGPTTYELDSVNFLIAVDPLDFLTGFAEIEVDGLLSAQSDRSGVRSDAAVTIERLYGDLTYDDALNLRVGKFLTPVGRWNPVPAEPFVWTPLEPVIVETAFDEHQTGGALFGSFFPGDHTVNYWIYGQFLDPLDPSSDPLPGHRSVGGRVEYESALGNWSLGSSFLATERKNQWAYLGGLDAYAQIGAFEFTTEFEYVDGDIPERDLWGVYAQGVYGLGGFHRFLRGLYVVGRYEHFDPQGTREDVNLGDVGLTWLPTPWLNAKAEYRFADRQTDEVRRGWAISISLLF